jgi:hypothetical protein
LSHGSRSGPRRGARRACPHWTSPSAGRRCGAEAGSALDPVFRGLAAVGAFHWLIDRQHLVNTFLTNLRGPDQPLRLLATTIRSITPITTTAGNVTTAFAALSYAGTLTVSIISDPELVPEHAMTAAALGAALRELTGV